MQLLDQQYFNTPWLQKLTFWLKDLGLSESQTGKTIANHQWQTIYKQNNSGGNKNT
jgi:hypothetical protein